MDVSSIGAMFGGAGDVGATPLDMGIGYQSEVPMSTGVSIGAAGPDQPANPNTVSTGLWEHIGTFLQGLLGGGASSDAKGNQTDANASEAAKLGKFVTSVQGLQKQFQNSKLAQQMFQQHVKHMTVMQGGLQQRMQTPTDQATQILQGQGLL